MQQRAAIYLRISQDRTGEGAGVARQEQDCRAKAAALDWQVTQVYSDNDVSAYTGKRRPQYEAMLDAIRAGKVDAVVVWDTDRLHRQPRELEAYADLCIARKVPTQTVQSGEVDLTDDDGLMMARFHGAMNAREMSKKSKRQKRANLQRAQKGEHFGTRRPFGYELDGVTVREPEAQAIREAFELVLSGGTLREVARRWNAAGLVTPQSGNEWDGTVASRTLRTARLAGIKVYHGEVVRGPDGEPIKAAWPAIVEPDVWHAAQAVLKDENRKLKFGTIHPSALLLAGVAVCSECGAKIHSGGRLKGRSRYRCSAMAGHCYREADPIDDYVEDVVMERLSQPDFIEQFRPAPEVGVGDLAQLRREADAIQARKVNIAEAFGDGAMTRAQFEAANVRADVQLAALEAQMPSTNTADAAIAKLVTGLDVLRGWKALSLEARRGVVDALMKVEILPPKTRRLKPYLWEYGIRRVNPETVAITWR